MPRAGFETIQNVKNYQENLIAFLGYKGSKSRFRAEEVISQEISRLRTVQKILLAQEKHLFASKSIISYEHLLQKIEEWNNSGASILLSNNEQIYTLIKDIQDTIQLEDFNNKLEQSLYQNSELQEIFFIESADKLSDEIITEFISRLNDYGEGQDFRITTAGKKAAMGNSSIKGNLGLLRYVTFVQTTQKDGRKGFKVTFNKNVSSKYKKRIYDIIVKAGIEIEKIQTNISQQSQTEIENIIIRKLPINGVAKNYIAKTLKKHFIKFGFNSSAAAIKGALGEIYWTSFWDFISNGKLRVAPVGLVRASGTNYQLPIDLILRGLGFQVKNYHINVDGIATIRKTIGLYSFLESRMEVSATDFENFYTSWGYNKVINTTHAKEVYQPLFDRFERIMEQASDNLEFYAQERMDKILKLDSSFQSEIDSQLKLTGGIEEKVNVAYLIDDKVVFGSDIIEAIIQQLEKGYASVTFDTFNINYTEPFTKRFWDDDDNTSPKSLMEKTKVEYTIKLDVTDLISAAINRLK